MMLFLGLAALTPLSADAALAAAAHSKAGGTGGKGKVDPGAPAPAAAPAGVTTAAGAKPPQGTSSTTSTSGRSSQTAPAGAAPSGPPSTDPALKPVDLGALPAQPGVLDDLRAEAEAKGSVRVLVTLNTKFTALGALSASAASTQKAAVQKLSDEVSGLATAQGATVNRTYAGDIPALALTVTPEALEALAGSRSVAQINKDGVSKVTDGVTVPLVGAADAQERGYHGGGGTAVVIMDTGVDYGHPNFGGRVSNAACYSGNSDCPNGATSQFGGDSGVPCTFASACDHGTHVAGIAAGQNPTYPGVADQAKIETIRVFHQGTCDGGVVCPLAYDSDILSGLQLADSDRGIGTASVNISIGGGAFSSNCDASYPTIKTAIDNLRSHNIMTAIAAGNDGQTNAVSFPGCISTATTIGATDNSDAVAGFSNSNALVDLYAPGVGTISSVPGGGYAGKSGTSMATPHVVGAAAMMESAIPGFTVSQEEAYLAASGPAITDPKSGLVRHRIQVFQAMGIYNTAYVNTPLSSNVVRDFRNPIPYSHRYTETNTNGYWSGVAIRPPASVADYDLYLYENSDLTTLLASSALGGDAVDFVVQDNNSGRRTSGDAVFPYVTKFTGSGRYQIEYGNDVQTIGDSTYNVTMTSPDVMAIRDSLQTVGVPTYYRVVPTNGGQNPELFLMSSTAGTASTYVQGRSSAVASSTAGAAGAAESFSYTASAGDYKGLVLINKSGSGNYTLYRDTTAPTGSVSINGGDATTTSSTVTASLSASDTGTGIQDMRVSTDGTFDSEPWEAYSTSRSVTLPAGTGAKTVYVQFRNNANMITSALSDTIDVIAAPGAPTVTGSTPSAGAISVAFTAPASDGNSAITSYTATCQSTDGGGTKTKVGTSSPILVYPLVASATYRCKVKATNAVGTGPFSALGSAVVMPPATAPPAVAVTDSVASAGAITVSFAANLGDGGSPITSYSVGCNSTDGGVNRVANGASSPLTVINLTGGKSYHCRVKGINAVGAGPFGGYGATLVIPVGVPAGVKVTATTVAGTTATVSFAPGNDGGTPITNYTVSCASSDGGTTRTRTGTSSPLQVPTLTAGKTYQCKVRATNNQGTGPNGPLGPVFTVPAALTSATPSDTPSSDTPSDAPSESPSTESADGAARTLGGLAS